MTVSERSFTGYPQSKGGYPFAGIVGMADLKLALLLNAVAPAIGGVLVRGEKGTAKSTVVRGLAALLPPVPVVAGCRYACDPAAPDPSCPSGPHQPGDATEQRPVTLAELPVGATEDRLVGSLDIERVLTSGVTAFQPGLLASAHRGLLYVDEVNLLHDHLVDLLLDAAALGINYVEREGVSVRHASRFLLVGTMNPEEGELRPQLLDRFGLTVEVAASRDPAERAEVVRRRLAFEADPEAFAVRFAAEGAELASRVVAARTRLPEVILPDAALRQICAVCGAFGVDGMRADLVTARTAMALAAWHGRDVVTTEDIRAAARLALPHRRRRDPFDAPGLDEQALDEVLNQSATDTPPPDDDPGGPGDGPGDRGPSGGPGPDSSTSSSRNGSSSPPETTPSPAETTPSPAETASSEAESAVPEGSQEPAPASAASRSPRSSADTASHPSASAAPPTTAAPTATFRARLLTVPGVGEGAPGRRSAARGPSGRTVGARLPETRPFPLHLPATIRAAVLTPPPATPATPATPHPATSAVPCPATPAVPYPATPATLDPATSAAPHPATSAALHPTSPAAARPAAPVIPDAAAPVAPHPATPTTAHPGVPVAPHPNVSIAQSRSLEPGQNAQPSVSIAQSSPSEGRGERVNCAIETRRGLVITPPNLREAIREGREGNLVLFVVDASGSMAARERMRTVKGAILSLLLDAYQRRDKVGLVSFRGRTAELALPPTSSVEAAARRLTVLPTGGRTPLAAGLAESARTLANERLRDPRRRPLLVLVTDGRATVGTGADLARAVAMLNGTAAVVIDCESSPVRLGLTRQVAAMLGAPVFGLDDLRAIATMRRAA